MAIKIIKDGKKEFNRTCPYCGCEFTYEAEDILNSKVECPCCSQYLPHNITVVYTNVSTRTTPKGTTILDNDLVYRSLTLPDWATKSDNWSGCEGCPNNPKYLKTPYIGDSPCQWCQKNPNKVTCVSNLK
jgi:hypothetical protein